MANMRAVITPWANIWSTAPLTPIVVRVASPISTKPIWLTLE